MGEGNEVAMHPAQTISEVIDSCLVYWLAAGLPRPQAEAMAEELRSHLEQAVTDGKSVRDVVGDDIAQFAAEWSREVRQPRPWRERALHVAFVLSQAALYTLLPGLWEHPFMLEVGHVAQMLWLATGIFVLFSPRFGARWLANSEDRRQAFRWFLVFLATFIGMLVLNPSLRIVPSVGLVRWERWQVLLVMGIALAVSWVAIRHDPTRPRAIARK